mgnify:CR=1 FL=1
MLIICAPMRAATLSGNNRSMIGREMGVLIQKPGRKPGQIAGRSPWLQNVIIDESAGSIGDIVPVRITSAAPNSLAGERLPAS